VSLEIRASIDGAPMKLLSPEDIVFLKGYIGAWLKLTTDIPTQNIEAYTISCGNEKCQNRFVPNNRKTRFCSQSCYIKQAGRENYQRRKSRQSIDSPCK
jgi:hypothetical protein